MVIEWDVVFNGNADISHYNLAYFINGSHPNTTVSKRVNTTSYEVTSLKPYTNYIFEVTATNEIGDSDFTRVSVNTKEDSKCYIVHGHSLVVFLRNTSAYYLLEFCLQIYFACKNKQSKVNCE